MTDYFVSVVYFSLPIFHEQCRIVTNHDLLLRDSLTCNPANNHVALCGQYDPHYELLEYKMCWNIARSNVYNKILQNNYDNIYLIFRTCLKNPFEKKNTHYVSGIYEVDQNLSRINPDYNTPCIRAKKIHFISVQDALDINDFYEQTPNPGYRMPFNSDTRNGIYRNTLSNWVNYTLTKTNRSTEYITETERLTNLFLKNEFSVHDRYEECSDCENEEKCPLLKRISEKNKVRYYIGEIEANRLYKAINDI